MILFHAKRDGTVTTTPDLVPQGSSMQDLVVVSEFDYAYCAIKLLPASGEYIEDITCTPILQKDYSTIFTAPLPPKATVVAGSVDYQLIFTAADGTTQTTLVGSFTVPRGVPAATPPTVGDLSVKTINDIYTIMANTYGLFVGHERNIYQNTEDIAALKKTIASAGYITIPVAEWSDITPYTAYMGFPSDTIQKGQVVLFMPLDDATKEAASKARLSVVIDEVNDGGGVFIDFVLFVKAEDGTAPTVDLNLGYIVLHTEGESDAMVALIGVDAYGEGGGGGGLTQAETETIVKKLVPEWARSSTPPDAQDVRADPEGTAQTLTEALAVEIAKDLGDYYPKTQTYSRTEIDGKISAIPKFSVKVVTSLPTSGISETTVYLVKDSTYGGGLYTEYIRVNNAWEELGSQTLDLSGYVTDDELEDAINAALSDYLTVKKAAELYQPKGNYLTQNDLPTIPTALPNPKSLTIVGKSYTGSTAVSVTADDILTSKSLTLVGEDASGNTYTYTIFGKEA